MAYLNYSAPLIEVTGGVRYESRRCAPACGSPESSVWTLHGESRRWDIHKELSLGLHKLFSLFDQHCWQCSRISTWRKAWVPSLCSCLLITSIVSFDNTLIVWGVWYREFSFGLLELFAADESRRCVAFCGSPVLRRHEEAKSWELIFFQASHSVNKSVSRISQSRCKLLSCVNMYACIVYDLCPILYSRTDMWQKLKHQHWLLYCTLPILSEFNNLYFLQFN